MIKNPSVIIVGILFLASIFLEGTDIFLANRLDSKIIYASKLHDEVNVLDQENLVLKSQVLQYTSFESIASRAAELGFSQEKQFVSLYSPSEVALKGGN